MKMHNFDQEKKKKANVDGLNIIEWIFKNNNNFKKKC